MVSSALTTIVSTTAEANNHHYQHQQQPQSARNFYFSPVGESKPNTLNISSQISSVINSGAAKSGGSASDATEVVSIPTTNPSSSLKNESTGASSSPLSDQISLLFPKCRPKNDVNLNPVQHNKSTNSPPSSLSSESLSSVTPRISTNPFLNINSNQERHPPYCYHSSLKDSQSSYPDMPRKRNCQGSNYNPFIKENYWDTRHNTTPASTVLNSPELTECDSRTHFMQKQHVTVGRSPVSHPESYTTVDLDTATRGVAVVADGEVVVFDDITESWQNLRVTTEQSALTVAPCKEDIVSNHYDEDSFKTKQFLDRNFGLPGDSRHGIMEYEGSPRKIGQVNSEDEQSMQAHRNSKDPNLTAIIYTARPGFPQRVISQLREPSPPHLVVKQSNAEDTSNDASEIGTASDLTTSEPQKSSTFDYLYEFSETRKVLEEFFKCPSNEEKAIENGSDVDSIDIHYEFRASMDTEQNNYIGQRLATSPLEDFAQDDDSPCQNNYVNGIDNSNDKGNHDIDFFLDSASRSSGEPIDNQDGINQNRVQSRTFRYSPETTDYDSNCGDLDSLSGDFNGITSYTNHAKYYAASMPVLEDGLSSGHASDTENNNSPATGISVLMDIKRPPENLENRKPSSPNNIFPKIESPVNSYKDESGRESVRSKSNRDTLAQSPNSSNKVFKNIDPDLDSLYSISIFHRNEVTQLTPPPPAPAPHRKPSLVCTEQGADVTTVALKDMRSMLQRAKSIPPSTHDKQRHHIQPPSPPPLEKNSPSPIIGSPVWVPRHLDTSKNCTESEHHSKSLSADEEDIDTDLETDRLLGHQRLDDQGFYDESKSWERKPRSLLASSLSKFSPKVQQTKSTSSSLLRQGLNSLLPTTPEVPPAVPAKNSTNKLLDIGDSLSSPDHSEKSPDKSSEIQNCNLDSPNGSNKSKKDTERKVKKSKNKEDIVLIEGVLFRARYLGSTQLVCEGQPTKSTRMMQAEEAVSRIKALAPDGEAQPSTEVDLFISTEKIMVLNTDLKEIMMDHALRTISYIADIGDLVVLMARRRFVPQDIDDGPKPNRTPKMICHVFESDEAQFIAQSIGQAFQVAYMEFLKANGIEDHSFVKEMDYQEVLNSQEIFGDELEIFAKKELQKEVVVPKAKGEILGVVIVESGWGSMLPTVVIANLMSSGAAARCGQLNIGDQLIAINGMSLVGLPLSTCQNYIKNAKNQTVVKFTVVPCAPVVEVKIKRPNTKYQLGFSVQNGVICSLLRGGIAERGGVRVGHRIIEINNQSVVAVPHEKIVNLLATSVGEILMKTMPTSMFRLLTGQENPIYI